MQLVITAQNEASMCANGSYDSIQIDSQITEEKEVKSDSESVGSDDHQAVGGITTPSPPSQVKLSAAKPTSGQVDSDKKQQHIMMMQRLIHYRYIYKNIHTIMNTHTHLTFINMYTYTYII